MVDGKYNVEIDGLGYILARQPRTGRAVYKRGEAPSFVNKMSTGDPSYRDATFWSHWVQINWQNGCRSEQFNDQARFLYDQNVNVHEEGRFQLAAKREDTGTVPSAGTAAAVCAFTHGWWGGTDWRLVAGNGLGGLYEANSSLSAWSEKYTIGNPPITTLLGHDSSWWLGSGVGSAATCEGTLYRISANGTFQSSSDINAEGINDLIVSFQPNLVSGSTGGRVYVACTGFTANGGQFLASNNNVSGFTVLMNSQLAKVTKLCEYNNRIVVGVGYPIGDITTPYFGKILTYDGNSMADLVNMYHTVPISMAVFDNMLFVGTAHGHLYVYNGSSFDLLFKFWGNDIDMKVNKLWVHQDKLHVLVSYDSSLKGSTTKYAGVWTFNRRGMSLDYKTDEAVTSAYNAVYTFKNQLMYSYGVAGKAVKINENLYQISGSLQSSYFDANLPSMDKLDKEVTLMYDYLSASTSAIISYKNDETESFTDLGTAKTEGTVSATFQFPSALAKKKLCYQVTLSTGAVSSTPRIKKVVTKYTVVPDFYHKWDFAVDASEKIQLLDRTFHPSSGLELESALFDAKRSKQLVEFKDIDYASTQLNGAIVASAVVINVDDASHFPPKGRLRLSSLGEELFYNSRTSTTLNGITRGYKNTTAVSAVDNTTIDLSYQVLFQAFNEEQFSLNQLAEEYQNITPVSLLEA